MSSRFDFYLPDDDYTIPLSSTPTQTYNDAPATPVITPAPPLTTPPPSKPSLLQRLFVPVPRITRFIIVFIIPLALLMIIFTTLSQPVTTYQTSPLDSVSDDPSLSDELPPQQEAPELHAPTPRPLDDDPRVAINNPAPDMPEQTIPGYGSLFISSRDAAFDNLSAATYGSNPDSPRKPFVPTTNGSVPVKQGMRISIIKKLTPDSQLGYSSSYTIDTQDCTLGYVDTQARIGYTSAHCVPNLNDSPAPYPVMVKGINDQGKEDNYVIGYIDTAPQTWLNTVSDNINPNDPQPLNIQSSQWDMAIIHFTGTAYLDPNDDNPLTGDFIIDNPLDIGTRICSFGATTLQVNCGEINDTNGWAVYEASIPVAQGDSGGPVWAIDDTGKPLGIIGITSAFSYIVDKNAPYDPNSVPTHGSQELITPLFARMYSTQAQIIKRDIKNETTGQLYEKQFRR